jgi:hypothetical protein
VTRPTYGPGLGTGRCDAGWVGHPDQLNSNGVTPIALLSTPTFDATTVPPTTIRVGPKAASVKETTAVKEDVYGDGHLDQVVHVVTTELIGGGTTRRSEAPDTPTAQSSRRRRLGAAATTGGSQAGYGPKRCRRAECMIRKPSSCGAAALGRAGRADEKLLLVDGRPASPVPLTWKR